MSSFATLKYKCLIKALIDKKCNINACRKFLYWTRKHWMVNC